MGKTLLPSSTATLQCVAKIIPSSRKPRHKKSALPTKTTVSLKASESRAESERVRKMEEASLVLDGKSRVPLSHVVSDCVKRWFQDTLREAKAGDVAMQVLVAQMYQNGYGVAKDAQKGNAWFNKASKHRPSAWAVRDKPPGYNASDSDSDELTSEPDSDEAKAYKT
ncbi:hypothetical protein Tsubulata_051178 [Turnera subulata]|uniref:Uncharacterized protein n=1 Tax=Turnera subulata TaxID=218843 RepID=A0A9Q0J964_9ROSI|nr:hypothetical protein Tsubulata_041083 [Turnera subulata]KAJ4851043.1 hypothetical protein Tsubulata_051178 [Turnera subulata]